MTSCYHPDKINPFSRLPPWSPVFVDGFRPVREDIDANLKASIDDNKPVFVLIVGQSGTGRSAAAKYVLDRYYALRGIAADHFIVPDVNVSQYDARLILGKWMQRLGRQGRRFTTDQTLNAEMQTTVTQSLDATYEDLFATLVERYATDMEQSQAAFGVLFENIVDFSLVAAAKTVFEDAVAPCVFTLELNHADAPKIRAAFDNLLATHQTKIELNYLSGEEVAEFAHDHWAACNPGGAPGPFEREGVRQVFSDRPRPIATARILLARLHLMKMQFENETPPWNAGKIAQTLPLVLLGDGK